MIIGVDLDEVLADFFPVYLDFHNRKYDTNFCKEDFVRWDFPGIFGVTKEESVKRLIEFDESNCRKDILPLSGAQEMTVRLAKKHVLHIITSRPLEIAEATIQWIEKHFPKVFSKAHFCSMNGGLVHFRSKSSVCQLIGATMLIDDHPNNAISCSEDGIQVCLFDQPWNRHIESSSNIVRMFSWQDEVIQLLC